MPETRPAEALQSLYMALAAGRDAWRDRRPFALREALENATRALHDYQRHAGDDACRGLWAEVRDLEAGLSDLEAGRRR